jgi:hypothetical protein
MRYPVNADSLFFSCYESSIADLQPRGISSIKHLPTPVNKKRHCKPVSFQTFGLGSIFARSAISETLCSHSMAIR